MKIDIIEKSREVAHRFGELVIGTCFIHNNSPYMKIPRRQTANTVNAYVDVVGLLDDQLSQMNPDSIIQLPQSIRCEWVM